MIHSQPRASRIGWLAKLVIFAAALLAGCGSLEDYPTAGSVYRATFQASPGPGVTLLQAGGRSWRDSSTCYLRFRATPAAFAALLGPGWVPETRTEYENRTGSGSLVGPLPTWWQPLGDAPTIFQESTTFHPTHNTGHAVVSYDPVNQVANLYWNGVD